MDWTFFSPPISISDFDPAFFWQWTDFLSYVEFIGSFSLVVGILTFLFINNTIYIEVLGFAAVFTEAMLGAPQFIRNFQNKSTLGMRWGCQELVVVLSVPIVS